MPRSRSHRAAWAFATLCLGLIVFAAHAASRGVPWVPPPVRSAGCSATGSVAPGDRQISLTVGERTRTATVHVPRRAAGAPAPLVLAFHGQGGSGPFMGGYSGLSRLADRAGFVVAYPTATGEPRRWTLESDAEDAPGDVAFTRALLTRLAGDLCLDQRRVSAVGVSNGGGFAARLACEMSDRIAAVVVVAGGLGHLPPCAPERPVSVLEIHGTADQVVPYGGDAAGRGAVRSWLAGWAARDGCRRAPVSGRPAPGVLSLSWRGCRDGVAVAHLALRGGMHQWPGATPPDPGPRSRISAAQEAWRFLAGRRLSAPR